MAGKQLPSEHQAERIKAEQEINKAIEERQRQEARERAAFDWLLKQENGRIVWGVIFRLCGYNKPSLSFFAAGDVAPLKTECKDAQRIVYLELRKMVPPELLAQAEYEAEFGVKPQTNEKGEK